MLTSAQTRLGFAQRATATTIRRPAPLRSPVLPPPSPTLESAFAPAAGSLLSKAHAAPLLPGLPDGREWAAMTAEQKRDAMNAATTKARAEGTTLFQCVGSGGQGRES